MASVFVLRQTLLENSIQLFEVKRGSKHIDPQSAMENCQIRGHTRKNYVMVPELFLGLTEYLYSITVNGFTKH